MRTISKTAAKTLEALTANLAVGEGRKIDNSEGSFMAVYVNRLSERTFSVSHYYEQNGDLCPDPDMVFVKVPHTGAWLPISITQWCGHRVALELDANDGITGFRPRALADMVSFTGTWMDNIKRQQGGLRALRKAAA